MGQREEIFAKWPGNLLVTHMGKFHRVPSPDDYVLFLCIVLIWKL